MKKMHDSELSALLESADSLKLVIFPLSLFHPLYVLLLHNHLLPFAIVILLTVIPTGDPGTAEDL